MTLILSLWIVGFVLQTLVHSKVIPDIKCTPDSLDVRVSKKGVQSVELEKWSIIPGCASTSDDVAFIVSLKLGSDLPCGTTRIRNKLTDETYYYHKLAITDDRGKRHLYKVTCFLPPANGAESNIVKRNVLPPEFVEPDYIEITGEVTGAAPIPELSVGVRQNGNLIGDQITVSPGAPLSMEVYLDSESASTYGILVSYMMVTDTSDKNETIIFNGCTQDHYVFENFKTEDGDFLTAKFRAFKFPESNYLLFRGTVDVCLDKCQGIQCSNGEIGFGRRRRAIPEGADPNKIFEVTMMTFIKVLNEGLDKASEFEFSNRRRIDSAQGLPPSLSYEREKVTEEESSPISLLDRVEEAENELLEESYPPTFLIISSGSQSTSTAFCFNCLAVALFSLAIKVFITL